MSMEMGFFILAILGACGGLWAYLENRIKAEVRLSQADRARLFERDEVIKASVHELRAEMLARYVDKDYMMRIEDKLSEAINALANELKEIRKAVAVYLEASEPVVRKRPRE